MKNLTKTEWVAAMTEANNGIEWLTGHIEEYNKKIENILTDCLPSAGHKVKEEIGELVIRQSFYKKELVRETEKLNQLIIIGCEDTEEEDYATYLLTLKNN